MRPKPLKILLVEDNLDHKELIVRNFNNDDVEFDHVSDGESALDFLFHRGAYADLKTCQLPHLILLDLRLPKIDGLEVLKETKASKVLRQIPVVILTTSAAERDLSRAYQHHANSYLVKPVSLDEFVRLMKAISMYWLHHNRTKARPVMRDP